MANFMFYEFYLNFLKRCYCPSSNRVWSPLREERQVLPDVPPRAPPAGRPSPYWPLPGTTGPLDAHPMQPVLCQSAVISNAGGKHWDLLGFSPVWLLLKGLVGPFFLYVISAISANLRTEHLQDVLLYYVLVHHVQCIIIHRLYSTCPQKDLRMFIIKIVTIRQLRMIF